MDKHMFIWMYLFLAAFAYYLGQSGAASSRYFTVGSDNITVAEIHAIPRAYNQCYVSIAVHNSSSHKYGLENAKITVLSRKPKTGSSSVYEYTGFSEGITSSTGRVCLLVYCHAEGLIFVEKNSVRIFAAPKSNQTVLPTFKVDIVYGNEMVKFHSFVWGTILGHTGPVYTSVEKNVCLRATMKDYHFVFSYISIPDKLVSTPAPVDSTDPMQTMAWRYGILDSDRRTCYLKVLIKTKSTQLAIRAYSRLNDASGKVFGLYESGAKYDISARDITSKAVCIQFRCPTQDLYGNQMNTSVQGTITDTNGVPICCSSYKEAATVKVRYQMNATSFSSTFVEGNSYGPNDGIYMATSMQQARSRCFTGHDFLGMEYAMDVNIGYAMVYDCTTICTKPVMVG